MSPAKLCPPVPTSGHIFPLIEGRVRHLPDSPCFINRTAVILNYGKLIPYQFFGDYFISVTNSQIINSRSQALNRKGGNMFSKGIA